MKKLFVICLFLTSCLSSKNYSLSYNRRVTWQVMHIANATNGKYLIVWQNTHGSIIHEYIPFKPQEYTGFTFVGFDSDANTDNIIRQYWTLKSIQFRSNTERSFYLLLWQNTKGEWRAEEVEKLTWEVKNIKTLSFTDKKH